MANREYYGVKRNRYLQQNGMAFSGGDAQHYEGIALASLPAGNDAILVKAKNHKVLIKTRGHE